MAWRYPDVTCKANTHDVMTRADQFLIILSVSCERKVRTAGALAHYEVSLPGLGERCVKSWSEVASCQVDVSSLCYDAKVNSCLWYLPR